MFLSPLRAIPTHAPAQRPTHPSQLASFMNITVIGAGSPGLVTAACLAELGHHVLCFDVDRTGIDALLAGDTPHQASGLAQRVRRHLQAGRLAFGHDVQAALGHGRVQFVAVGLPPAEDDAADLQHVLTTAMRIGQRMYEPTIIVLHSSSPADSAAAPATGTSVVSALAIEADPVSADPDPVRAGIGSRTRRRTSILDAGQLHDPAAMRRSRWMHYTLGRDASARHA